MPEFNTNRRELLRAGAFLAAGSVAGFPSSAVANDTATRAASIPKLKISRVTTYLLRHKLKRPFGVSVSVPLDQFRSALLVKIETDAGLVGWGETAPVHGTRAAIDESLAPRLIGQNPLHHRKLWRKIWGANFGNALAVGALDMALDDLRGKALNLPVAELYGGRYRDRVPAYASALNYLADSRPEEQFPAEAVEKVQMGFRAIKMRLGRYPVAREAKVAAAVRDAVGPKIQLMVDANAGYTMSDALKMGHVLHELDYQFFEEPLPQSPKYAGYDDLRRKLPIALAAGEAVDSRATAKELLDRRAMDIIQPDVSLCGGIGEVLFIAEMAALSGIRCLPHCWGGAILIAATTHLMSLLPDPHWGFPTDTPMLEFDQSENPWRTEIVKHPAKIQDGFVDVPTGPGLGIELDEAAVKSYAV